jgi:glycosyltransferase involved in cell wall biosynthesis
MRILIVTYYYAPIGNPRAYRWSGIAERLVALGHEVDVITSRPPNTATREEREGVNVLRSGSSLVSRLRARFSGSGGVPRNQPKSSRPPRSGLVRRVLRKVHDLTWKKVYWPDHACLWYFPARALALQSLRTKPYDALLSVSPEFVGHLVGLACKKAFPSLPWVVDVGDPFSLMVDTPANNLGLYRSLNHRVEASVLASSDRMALTNSQALILYERSFPEAVGKASVILPMSRVAPAPPPTSEKVGDRWVLAYFGVLYRNIREPDALLNLLRSVIELDPGALDWLEVQFYGDVSTCLENFEQYADLKGVLRFPGYVPYSQLGAYMANVDVLVNLGNATRFQLPSKGADYIASGMPILNLSRHKEDNLAEILKDHPLALTLSEEGGEGEEQARQLLDFLRASRGRRLSAAEVKRLHGPFTVETIADQYLDLLSAPVVDRTSPKHETPDMQDTEKTAR